MESNNYTPENLLSPLPYNISNDKKISELLCGIAQMDGWHDHNSIKDLDNQEILKLV
jgi:hypothetical protein